MKCPFCSEEILEGAIKCKHCGEVLKKDEYARVATERAKIIKDYGRFTTHYQEVFKQIDEKNGSFRPKWNWAAFLFGFFWYLSKGMWVKGLVMIAITFAFSGVPVLFFWLYGGIAGNFDYYLYAIQGKQLW
jgi:uncharacterized protein DUF2628